MSSLQREDTSKMGLKQNWQQNQGPPECSLSTNVNAKVIAEFCPFTAMLPTLTSTR